MWHEFMIGNGQDYTAEFSNYMIDLSHISKYLCDIWYMKLTYGAIFGPSLLVSII